MGSHSLCHSGQWDNSKHNSALLSYSIGSGDVGYNKGLLVFGTEPTEILQKVLIVLPMCLRFHVTTKWKMIIVISGHFYMCSGIVG